MESLIQHTLVKPKPLIKNNNCILLPRTQPLICVGHSVHYWVYCAINKGDFLRMRFVVDTHLPQFEALAYDLPHFDALTRVVILVSAAFIFQSGLLRSDILCEAFIF